MISKPLTTKANPVAEQVASRASTTANMAEKRSGQTTQSRDAVTPSSMSHAKSGRWGWVITCLVLASVGAAGWYYNSMWIPQVKALVMPSGPPAKPPARPIPVVTAVAKKRDMDLYLNALGTVTALKTVTVRSRVEGEILSIDFTEGQMVHEGQLLAEIDPRMYEVQRDQAKGQLIKDQAGLKIAQLNLNRLNKLLPTMAVTQQAVDEQAALVEQAEGAIKTDEATIANAELQISYSKIMAPITGRIGLRLVDKGNIIAANDTRGIAVITQLEPISLVFTIPQDEIPRVQRRMREGHQLAVDAYDRDFQTKLATGVLKAIDNQVDPTTGTLKMRAEFEKNNNVLFPNQFVNTRMLVDTRRNAIVVPSAAVQRGPNSTFVYLVKDDETVDLQNVDIGPSEGSDTIIESGLNSGQIVVTDGIDKLQPKSKITTRDKKSEATADGKKTTEKSKAATSHSTAGDKPERASQSGAADSPIGKQGTEQQESRQPRVDAKSAAAPDNGPQPKPTPTEASDLNGSKDQK